MQMDQQSGNHSSLENTRSLEPLHRRLVLSFVGISKPTARHSCDPFLNMRQLHTLVCFTSVASVIPMLCLLLCLNEHMLFLVSFICLLVFHLPYHMPYTMIQYLYQSRMYLHLSRCLSRVC